MSERSDTFPGNLERDDWFFIVGCQRSGTTLVRLALECHSQIECWDELIAYDVLASRARPQRKCPMVGLKVPSLTEQFDNQRMEDPFVNLDIENPYRSQKLIFMVRDVRDTVLSMLRLCIFGMPWINARAISTMRAKVKVDSAFAHRYGDLFELAMRARDPRLTCAALYWRYKVESLFGYMVRYPVLPIRYEDLTLRPERELRRLCTFIGVPWEAGLLNHPQFFHGELTPDGMAIGDTNPRRGIDTKSINQWRGLFSATQLLEIMEIAGIAQSLLYPCEIHSTVATQPNQPSN